MIDNLILAIDGAWRVLIIGLALGAGLPVLFAFGVRAYAHGAGDGEHVVAQPGTRRLAKAVAYACFALVVLGIIAGIGAIVASGFDVELSSVFD